MQEKRLGRCRTGRRADFGAAGGRPGQDRRPRAGHAPLRHLDGGGDPRQARLRPGGAPDAGEFRQRGRLFRIAPDRRVQRPAADLGRVGLEGRRGGPAGLVRLAPCARGPRRGARPARRGIRHLAALRAEGPADLPADAVLARGLRGRGHPAADPARAPLAARGHGLAGQARRLSARLLPADVAAQRARGRAREPRADPALRELRAAAGQLGARDRAGGRELRHGLAAPRRHRGRRDPRLRRPRPPAPRSPARGGDREPRPAGVDPRRLRGAGDWARDGETAAGRDRLDAIRDAFDRSMPAFAGLAQGALDGRAAAARAEAEQARQQGRIEELTQQHSAAEAELAQWRATAADLHRQIETAAAEAERQDRARQAELAGLRDQLAEQKTAQKAAARAAATQQAARDRAFRDEIAAEAAAHKSQAAEIAARHEARLAELRQALDGAEAEIPAPRAGARRGQRSPRPAAGLELVADHRAAAPAERAGAAPIDIVRATA